MLTKLAARDSKGFTLIELMIVIAIIGILAAIAIPQFSAYRKRGFHAAAESDLRNVMTSQEAYYADFQRYNGTLANLNNYGYQASGNVTVTINTGTSTFYNMSSSHSNGDNTYTIRGPGGSIGS